MIKKTNLIYLKPSGTTNDILKLKGLDSDFECLKACVDFMNTGGTKFRINMASLAMLKITALFIELDDLVKICECFEYNLILSQQMSAQKNANVIANTPPMSSNNSGSSSTSSLSNGGLTPTSDQSNSIPVQSTSNLSPNYMPKRKTSLLKQITDTELHVQQQLHQPRIFQHYNSLDHIKLNATHMFSSLPQRHASSQNLTNNKSFTRVESSSQLVQQQQQQHQRNFNFNPQQSSFVKMTKKESSGALAMKPLAENGTISVDETSIGSDVNSSTGNIQKFLENYYKSSSELVNLMQVKQECVVNLNDENDDANERKRDETNDMDEKLDKEYELILFKLEFRI